MNADTLGLLRFEETYFERVWGGNRLQTLFNKPVPSGTPIGEAWLISDHPTCESVVKDGPCRGMTLRQLVQHDPDALLGIRPRLTPDGRFPLLLKLLDACDVLSVQVHPDDACALKLGEPDGGKTEMWLVLDAEPGSKIICGLDPSITHDGLAKAVSDGSIEKLLIQFEAHEGMSVFVPAGTVHALGAGSVVAEIQQNSDLTYRLYDWNRLGTDGQPRALHVEKALKAIHFGAPKSEVKEQEEGVLASCSYFAAELVRVEEHFKRAIHGATFHIALCTAGTLTFVDLVDDVDGTSLHVGEALLVPGAHQAFEVHGQGAFLDYYVPDLPCADKGLQPFADESDKQ